MRPSGFKLPLSISALSIAGFTPPKYCAAWARFHHACAGMPVSTATWNDDRDSALGAIAPLVDWIPFTVATQNCRIREQSGFVRERTDTLRVSPPGTAALVIMGGYALSIQNLGLN
jgi:hypothetical protein